MNYKFKEALKKSKWMTIIMIAIWFALTILFTAPIAASIIDAKTASGVDSNDFFGHLISNITDVGGNLGKIFRPSYFGTFCKVELYVTICVIFMYIIGFIKQMPKNEYSGIESGSSDWATGEQYRILNRKEGILLAENHYLPVDKRGNVNVLVVGRFWFSENLHHMLSQMLINF